MIRSIQIQWNDVEINPHYTYHEKTTGGDIREIINAQVEIHNIYYEHLDIFNVYSLDEIEDIATKTQRVHEQRMEVFDEAFGQPIYNETLREEL